MARAKAATASTAVATEQKKEPVLSIAAPSPQDSMPSTNVQKATPALASVTSTGNTSPPLHPSLPAKPGTSSSKPLSKNSELATPSPTPAVTPAHQMSPAPTPVPAASTSSPAPTPATAPARSPPPAQAPTPAPASSIAPAPAPAPAPTLVPVVTPAAPPLPPDDQINKHEEVCLPVDGLCLTVLALVIHSPGFLCAHRTNNVGHG